MAVLNRNHRHSPLQQVVVHLRLAVPHREGQGREPVPVRRLQQRPPAPLHQPVHHLCAPVQGRHVQRRVAQTVRRAEERAHAGGDRVAAAGREPAVHLVEEEAAQVGAAHARAEGEGVLAVDAPARAHAPARKARRNHRLTASTPVMSPVFLCKT